MKADWKKKSNLGKKNQEKVDLFTVHSSTSGTVKRTARGLMLISVLTFNDHHFKDVLGIIPFRGNTVPWNIFSNLQGPIIDHHERGEGRVVVGCPFCADLKSPFFLSSVQNIPQSCRFQGLLCISYDMSVPEVRSFQNFSFSRQSNLEF